jgi:2-polyprenyl-3-methyl-5-hydroxy-6-metoxy-1,4-benzoquinol methylase
MDDFSINDDRVDDALNEIKLVNKFLGGISTSKAGFRILFNHNKSKPVKVLDIGSGASDIFEALQKRDLNLKVYSLDRNERICEVIKAEKTASPIYGDAQNLPIKKESVSVVHASLFLHHFTEVELKEIFKSSLDIAKNGIIINDLRRSVWALIGIKLLIFIFSKSSMVKNDAPLSVKKAFIKSDLINILKSLNITNYKIKRKWAFRWLVVIPKDQ